MRNGPLGCNHAMIGANSGKMSLNMMSRMYQGPRRVRLPGIEPGSTPRTQTRDSAGSVSSLRCNSGLWVVRVSAEQSPQDENKWRAGSKTYIIIAWQNLDAPYRRNPPL